MTETVEDKSAQILAPWSRDQVAALNDWQWLGFVHPFTCGFCGEILCATTSGWICLNGTCQYRQNWAWAFMADREDPVWTNPLDRILKEAEEREPGS